MPIRKEIIILGDIEIGGGTLTDDFISDKAISKLILELSHRPHAVDLVLNGDTFDFLKCPLMIDGKSTYPRHITSEVSLAKLDSMEKAHSRVFIAWKNFLKKPNNNLYFIYGNHDMDLLFKEVQTQLISKLGNKDQVHFNSKYNQHQVYTEHGMQYDYLCKLNLKKPFLIHEGKKILNKSWSAFGLIGKFMYLKEEHPFLERIADRPFLFAYYKPVLNKVSKKAAAYFFKSIIYYPIRHYSDPTYTFPKGLFSEFYRRVKEDHWDIDKIMTIFERKMPPRLKENKIFVLGHVHEPYLEEKKGQVLIHSGSWRDDYDAEPKTQKLTARPKKYVQIYVEGRRLDYQLMDYPIARTSMLLKNVIKNEKHYLRQAAKEEDFKLSF